MDRYPLLVYLGAGILGSLGAEMIMTDSFTVHAFQPSGAWRHGAEVAGAMAVLAVGRRQTARRRSGESAHPSNSRDSALNLLGMESANEEEPARVRSSVGSAVCITAQRDSGGAAVS